MILVFLAGLFEDIHCAFESRQTRSAAIVISLSFIIIILYNNITLHCILLFLHRLVFGHKFILKNERFKFKRTMFAKLFGVKEPFSSNCYIKARKEDALRLKQTRKR